MKRSWIDFLENIIIDRWYPAIVTDLGSELRIGELVALKWKENIDLNRGIIRVEEAIADVNTYQEEGPKTVRKGLYKFFENPRFLPKTKKASSFRKPFTYELEPVGLSFVKQNSITTTSKYTTNNFKIFKKTKRKIIN